MSESAKKEPVCWLKRHKNQDLKEVFFNKAVADAWVAQFRPGFAWLEPLVERTAQPQQEPVAQYIGECSEGSLVQLYDDVKKGAKLYTSPPAQQEPVAWMDRYGELYKSVEQVLPTDTPLYTAPPQRKPLTDEQLQEIGKELGLKCRLGGNPNIDFDYARAIEAAHNIKENT